MEVEFPYRIDIGQVHLTRRNIQYKERDVDMEFRIGDDPVPGSGQMVLTHNTVNNTKNIIDQGWGKTYSRWTRGFS